MNPRVTKLALCLRFTVIRRYLQSYQFYHRSARPSPTSKKLIPQVFSRQATTMASATTFWDFKPLDKKGEQYPTADLKGKVVLVVNTASECGFTKQFKGLEELYQEVKSAPNGGDFQMLGFPCNQFGGQDPGSNDEIQTFCQKNFGVTFPVLGKTNVNGNDAEPLYEWMKSQQPGLMGMKRIKWNFEKFLIGKDGQVKGRWASTTKPESLKSAILKELGTEGKSEL